MKTITMILFTIILNACGGTKQAGLNSNSDGKPQETALNKNNTQETETVIFEYSAITRGSFYILKINEKKVSTQINPNEKAAFKDISEENWKALMQLVNNIDLRAMEKMEAPSQKRFYDGAATAELKITKGQTTYQSPNFDAGNPNEGLTDLINKMLEIGKNKE